MPSKTQKLLSIILTALLPGTLLAAPNQVSAAGIVNSLGEVVVNNQPASHSRAVFVGDNLRTGENSTARVTMTGSTLTVGPQSTATFGSNMVALACGSVDAVTSAKLGTTVGGVSVVPTSSTARYSVTTVDGGLRIVALAGSLVANDGQKQQVVDSGKEVTLAAHTGCAVTSPDDMKGGMSDKDKMHKRDRAAWIPWAIGGGVIGGGIAALIVTNRGGGKALSQTLP